VAGRTAETAVQKRLTAVNLTQKRGRRGRTAEKASAAGSRRCRGSNGSCTHPQCGRRTAGGNPQALQAGARQKRQVQNAGRTAGRQRRVSRQARCRPGRQYNRKRRQQGAAGRENHNLHPDPTRYRTAPVQAATANGTHPEPEIQVRTAEVKSNGRCLFSNGRIQGRNGTRQ